jgi:hypothetical protein
VDVGDQAEAGAVKLADPRIELSKARKSTLCMTLKPYSSVFQVGRVQAD